MLVLVFLVIVIVVGNYVLLKFLEYMLCISVFLVDLLVSVFLFDWVVVV